MPRPHRRATIVGVGDDTATLTKLRDTCVAAVEAWPKIATEHRLAANHCILAARVASLVIPDAVPLVVSVCVANNIAQPLFGHGPLNRPVDEIATGAWTVGTDEGPTRIGQYRHHLVAVVADRWILDLSAPQLSRPRRGIIIKAPLMFDLEEPYERSTIFNAGAMWNLRDLTSGIGWYHLVGVADSPTDYKRANDWAKSKNHAPLVAALREAIDGVGQ